MDLYRTPYTLAKLVAGSKLKLTTTIFIHIIIGCLYIYSLPEHPQSFLIFMVVFPANYLYALYWLINFVEEKQLTMNNNQ